MEIKQLEAYIKVYELRSFSRAAKEMFLSQPFVGAKIDNHKCVYERLMSEKLILIAPYEQHFQQTGSTDIPRLLRDEYFVMRESGSGTRLEYEEFLKKIGVAPDELKVSAWLNNTQSIIHAVASGLGLSFVSELAANPYIKQRLIIPIDAGGLSERSFYIVLKKNRSATPTTDAFIKFAISYARNNG